MGSGEGPAETGTGAESTAGGCESESPLGVLPSVDAGPGTLGELVLVVDVLVPVTVVVAALVPASGAVTSARASATIASAISSARRMSVSFRPVIGSRTRPAGDPARPPRTGAGRAPSEHQLLAWFCPPCWPVPAELPAPLRAPLMAVWLALLAPP